MEETTVKALFALYLIIGLLTAEGIVVWNEGLKEMLDDYQGWNEVFSWHPVQESGLYDEIEVKLPEGAKMVKNGFDQDAVELANGCICPDLLTMRRRGIAYPYIVDTTGDKPRNIFLKEMK